MTVASRQIFQTAKERAYDAEVEWLGRNYGELSFIRLPLSMHDKKLHFEMSFAISRCGGSTGFFGGRSRTSGTHLALFSNGTLLATNASGGYDSSYKYLFSAGQFHTLTNPGQFLVVDGVTTNLQTAVTAICDDSISYVGLFNFVESSTGEIFDTTADRYSDLKFRYVKLFDDEGTALYDLVPVVKDGVGYMFDRVTGTLFGNSGEGSFAFGPTKN